MEGTKGGSKCWNSTVQGKDLQKACSVSFNKENMEGLPERKNRGLGMRTEAEECIYIYIYMSLAQKGWLFDPRGKDYFF